MVWKKKDLANLKIGQLILSGLRKDENKIKKNGQNVRPIGHHKAYKHTHDINSRRE